MNKKLFVLAYILFLIFCGIFINLALKTKYIQTLPTKNSDPAIESHPAKVSLEVNGMQYTLDMTTVDTVSDFLEKLRSSGKIYYERTAYVQGFRIDTVNNVTGNWRIFNMNNDITNALETTRLSDGAKYSLLLVP